MDEVWPALQSMKKKKEKIELKSIQYHALRIPYNKPLMFSHSELLQLANAKTIDERSKETNKKYFEKSFIFNNELAILSSII